MQGVNSEPEDFRGVLRKKALNHSLFYMKLGDTGTPPPAKCKKDSTPPHIPPEVNHRHVTIDDSEPSARVKRGRVTALVKKFTDLDVKDYLQLPRTVSPASSDDICSSDDEDRLAVRGRSRDLSDDSAVEVEPRRKPKSLILTPRSSHTLIEAHEVELGRRGSEGEEGKPRTVRTPSVVVSDYSEGEGGLGPWLRSRALSADSACSSCSTLSSREDDDFEDPSLPKKI